MALGSLLLLNVDLGDDMDDWLLFGDEFSRWVDGTPVIPSNPSASSSCWFLFIAWTYCCCRWRWYTNTVAFSSCQT